MTWLLTASVLASAAGCGWMKETVSPRGTTVLRGDVANSPPPQAVRSEAKKEPLRQPQAMTCVDLGEKCCEQAADRAKDEAARRDWLHKALINYDQALKIDPHCAPALVGMGRVYKKQGDTQKATDCLEQAIQLSPHSAAAWYELAMCHGAQKQWDNQIACLRKAVSLEQTNPFYTKQLGLALARAERFSEGYPLLVKTMGPAQANYNLALMALHLRRPDLCQGYLEAALAADAELTPARNLLAQLRAGQPATVRE